MAINYWEIRVSGWSNVQTVCGEKMTADKAIQATGAKEEDCWTPTQVSEKNYAKTVAWNSQKNNK